MQSIIQRLEVLQSHMSVMKNLLADAQQTASRQAEGTDRSGGVKAILAPDGLPEAIVLTSGWQRRVRPADLSAAVREACQAAGEQQAAAWATAFAQANVPARLAALNQGQPTDGAGAEARSADHPQAVHEAAEPPRPLAEVMEDALTILSSATRNAAPDSAVAQGSGSDGSGRIVVVLTQQGLSSCEMDAHWTAQQSGSRIAAAFKEAVGSARTSLASALARSEPAKSRALAIELIAHLTAQGQQFGTEGGNGR
ncbi:hypothetical protein OG455_14340 [Kitasatospora sp. NBC_01287]|uniref:hypothetical protein n=1 Tax=Kitasatospora sp. NBC_01287 TaxID=2903573 RepID=UPI0022576694|nr:hypothetical protein [Kitasatospora sp. NBC_01287]MCX4746683.1 hypothetical protein [Kitasatospora sp. NBC_01287]